MSYTYTTNLRLAKPDFDEATWWDALNDNWDEIDGYSILAALKVKPAEIPSASLDVAVNAGKYLNLDGTVASYTGTSSFAMTASTINYVFLSDVNVLTVNTTGYPSVSNRLARVTTNATVVTAIDDDRVTSAIGGDLSSLYLPKATGGTVGGAITVSAGGLTVSAGGIHVTLGGLTVDAGGLTVTDGGVTITNVGMHIVAGGITVDAGGLTVTAGGLTVTAGASALPATTFNGNVTFADALSIVGGSTTGLKILTATTQKLGFFNATPVTQPVGGQDVINGLVTLGLRATNINPPMNMGSGALTCGTITGGNITCGTLAPSGNITTAEGAVIVTGTTTGLKIGGNTTQKIGIYNAVPVVQALGTSDVLASLVSFGLRAASSNPPLNLGSGVITCGTLNITDAFNLVFGTTTGSKIGTAVGQKIAFWNATPIVQPSGAAQVALGALTATGLTDSTTGTADSTLADVTASHDQALLNNNFADLAAKYNAALADITAMRTLVVELRAVLVAEGLMKGSV
jgi:hypothetical protein